MNFTSNLKSNINQNKKFRLLACVLSGIFSSVPFFFEKLFIIEWVSQIPFFYIIFTEKETNVKRSFLYGFIYNFTRSVIVLSWFKELYSMSALEIPAFIMILVIIAAVLGLSALQSVVFGFSSALVIKLSKNINLKLFIPFFTAILFTGGEFINTLLERSGLIGFPWVLTYITQGAFTEGIQTASIFGAEFISFLIILCNCLFAYAFTKCGKVQKICYFLPLILFTLNFAYGIISVYKAEEEPYAKVLAYQDNNSSYSKWFLPSKDVCDELIYDLEAKYDIANMPQLIVLSETVFPVDINMGKSGRYIAEKLCDFTKKYSCTIVAGGFLVENGQRYNAQFVFENGRLLDTVYKKRTLVPFGEYIPAEKFLSGALTFIDHFNLSGEQIGKGIETNIIDCGFTKLGGLICYDTIFYYNSKNSAKENAHIFVVSTNDSWYNDSAAANQHYMHSVFRAVETRKPVIRSATTGFSGIIDKYGRTVARTNLLQKDFCEGYVSPNSIITPFVLYGYLWYYFLFGFSIFYIIISKIRRKENET